MTTLAAILGSATPPGRLASAVSAALDRLALGGAQTHLLDLGQLSVGFADGRPLDQLSDDTPELVKRVSEADAVLLATPVYRATMTGVLKNALDVLPIEALQGKPVAILAMGATVHHFLGAESHLRDVLAWFGALALPTAVYLSSADFQDGKLSENAAGSLGELLDGACRLAEALRGLTLGPAPLAAVRRG